MHDLRLKVLRESGKTTSRKARSRPESTRASTRNSPMGSPAPSQRNSPSHSRAGSRYASENESSDDEFEDSMTMSTLSNGSEAVFDESNESTWQSLLQDRIVELQDRKRSSVQSREAAMASYLNLIKLHFADRQVGGSATDIITALVRSVRSGGSALERSLALRAIQATLLTSPSDSAYDDVYQQLQTTCEDDEEASVKSQAILAMAIMTLYGGGSEQSAEELLDFMVGVIESDGESIGAGDNGEVVSAALQAWSFVASQIDDLSDQVHEAMDAFVEQLDSSDVDVQTGAGFNIAFIFEAARDHEEETGEVFNLQYDPKKLISRMAEASKPAAKHTSRKDRRHLRKHFASIVTSLEHGKGPGYSTSGRPASNPHTGGSKVEHDKELDEFGYREKLRVGDHVVVIDSWSLMARIDVVRSVMGSGFPVHFNDNPTVSELLNDPDTEDLPSYGVSSEPKRSKKIRR
ncbi:interferon-related developmental regulator-domain-containing protein [Plectosphaerella cucumerina]|uniref:Interferon-related developmental regulator-domain-containing protein n=1 Tax=Plectosphaerella cucumerina TaxID=40658 RepID=A0A8K0X0N5_9PEZI|nr:interferon-related developmental regulator-domain-containing protein [Plectosphaerella cucumerina]